LKKVFIAATSAAREGHRQGKGDGSSPELAGEGEGRSRAIGVAFTDGEGLR
jgi:hypothetical protein